MWVEHGTGCLVTLSHAGKHPRSDALSSNRRRKVNLAISAASATIGPEKGTIHLTLASVNNAVLDTMFATSRKKKLWKLIADMIPVRRLVFSHKISS